MITQERIRELVNYDPETGKFTARTRRGKIAEGAVLGTAGGGGAYLAITLDRHRFLAHRLAWIYMTGDCPPEIDHANGDGRDNRFTNLREASRQQNAANVAKQKNNTSGYKGVSFHKGAGKWRADIKRNYTPIYLGLFDTKESAQEAYMEAATRLFGEFARGA